MFCRRSLSSSPISTRPFLPSNFPTACIRIPQHSLKCGKQRISYCMCGRERIHENLILSYFVLCEIEWGRSHERTWMAILDCFPNCARVVLAGAEMQKTGFHTAKTAQQPHWICIKLVYDMCRKFELRHFPCNCDVAFFPSCRWNCVTNVVLAYFVVIKLCGVAFWARWFFLPIKCIVQYWSGLANGVHLCPR